MSELIYVVLFTCSSVAYFYCIEINPEKQILKKKFWA